MKINELSRGSRVVKENGIIQHSIIWCLEQTVLHWHGTSGSDDLDVLREARQSVEESVSHFTVRNNGEEEQSHQSEQNNPPSFRYVADAVSGCLCFLQHKNCEKGVRT